MLILSASCVWLKKKTDQGHYNEVLCFEIHYITNTLFTFHSSNETLYSLKLKVATWSDSVICLWMLTKMLYSQFVADPFKEVGRQRNQCSVNISFPDAASFWELRYKLLNWYYLTSINVTIVGILSHSDAVWFLLVLGLRKFWFLLCNEYKFTVLITLRCYSLLVTQYCRT